MKRSRGPGAAIPPGRRLEIQIHPSDIRKRVRYLFLTPTHLWVALGVLVPYLVLVIFAISVAPAVVSSLLSRHEHRSLLAERARQGERLEAMVGRLGELESREDDLRLRLGKIFLVYGLDIDEASGQGGYPFEPAPVPSQSTYRNAIENGNRLAAHLHEESRVLDTFLGEVRAFEAAHQTQVRTTPSISPLRGDSYVLTSPFGNRRSPFTKQLDFHAGIDLAAPEGTEIHAPADGLVTFAGRFPLKRSVGWWRYGNLVVLRNGDRFITIFGHCDKVRVRRGQRVRQGDLLANVGSTGWSTSPHLHYEVRRRDEDGEYRPVDPRIYILDHRWRDEERLLVRVRSAPDLKNYEPLPPVLAR